MTEEEIILKMFESLESDEPEDVSRALEYLDNSWKRRQFASFCMPEPSCLDVFGEYVPDEALKHYTSLIAHYPYFRPTPSMSDIRHALVEAIVRYGHGRMTFEVALFLRIDASSDFAVQDTLRYVEELGLNNNNEIDSLRCLIEDLLDSQTTRQATINILRMWKRIGLDPFVTIVESIRPQLSSSENAKLIFDEND